MRRGAFIAQATLAAVLASCGLAADARAFTVTLSTHSAVVWGQEQIIRGAVFPPLAATGILYVNGIPHSFVVPAPGDSFSVSIRIGRGTSAIVARVDSAGVLSTSDTVKLTLGYVPLPEVQPYATVSGRTVTLHAAVVDNPDTAVLSFRWSEDAGNPASVGLSGATDSTCSFELPAEVPGGEYTYSLFVVSAGGDSVTCRTFVTVDSTEITPVDIANDHSAWIDHAVIYEVTPYNFVGNGRYADITDKIPELASLGVNVIWLQPVYATHGGGQGYDVVDYFNLRTDLGTEGQLRTLIQTAHAHGMHVLFDFVPNHTSLYHPYAQDAVAFGAQSHYYDFFERAKDSAPYSSNENLLSSGKMQFVYYFWNTLVNLNYDNPEVQRMIIEAGKYWIRRLGIDGYRLDAVWAVNARRPAFLKQWRLAIKRIRPDALILGEEKASVKLSDPSGRPCPFDQRCDVAYDWTPEESWVSHWSWQAYYSSSSNPTIFNTASYQTAAALRNSLTNNGQGYDPRAVVLHFMENNDTYRFLATHDLARTRMVAELMFALPGIPLLYNGQEIGFPTHPYSTYAVFNGGVSIESQDQYGLFPYYQTLIRLRGMFPALASKNFQAMTVSPSTTVYGFHRWDGGQNLFVLTNMSSSPVTATAALPVAQLELDTTMTYYLTDLLTNEYFSGSLQTLRSVQVPLAGYSTRAFILADTVVHTVSVGPIASASAPGEFSLAQNYPNPFNPSTTITFNLPAAGAARLTVYDILGRVVTTLVDGDLLAGAHAAVFDAEGLASGVYLYRLQFGGRASAGRMLLMK